MAKVVQPLTAQRPQLQLPTTTSLAPTARRPHKNNVQERGRGTRLAPQTVTLAKRDIADDATVHHPPPLPHLPQLPRPRLGHPVLPVAITLVDASTSDATANTGDTPLRTTTQDPFPVPPLYQRVYGIVLDEVNLSYLINYYSLKAYRLLQRPKQSRANGRLPIYLLGLRHGIDTYAFGLRTIVPWPLSLLSIRRSW